MQPYASSLTNSCPLCQWHENLDRIKGLDERAYYHCPNCSLIFSGPSFQLSEKDEQARYEEHNNGIQYPGYVRFINQAIEPALPYLNSKMKGLDYGCGPGPALSILLGRQGISCEDYDPYFFPRELNSTYDFIFATECFEHFNHPDREIKRLKKLLKPGGILTIMTIQWSKLEDFSTWHYSKDPTHVSFFHQETFRFICNQYGFEEIPCKNNRVIILRSI
ncbi:MAG: class I SAM-dependent methyltransferase [Balneolales bacterium]